MFEAAESLRAELVGLEREMSDPAINSDASRSRRVGRRYAELKPIVSALDEYERLREDLAAARELGADDAEFAAEAERLQGSLDAVTERITKLLAPRDPNDSNDAILEIKSGEGGEESALFAGDLLNMYTRYAESQGWKVEVLDEEQTDLGGYKSVTVAVRARAHTDPANMPFGVLKFEAGVHRVQRVPVTESQGRIHTSAAGVLVFPDLEDADEIEINDDDLRIDVYRSSGKGGQGVNTTDSAVRITHLPTNTVVTCQTERSQVQNRAAAMRILRVRLAAVRADEEAVQAEAARKSQVRTVDRSERIRTYHFPENRITDHRIGFKAHNLDAVLGGALEDVVAALQAADLAERLDSFGDH